MVAQRPIMYKSPILKRRKILIYWTISVLLSAMGYFYHNRPSRVWLIAFFPQHLIQLIILLLGHIIAKLTHHSIYNLFSIDLSQGMFIDLDNRYDNSVLKSDLEDLFVSSEKFDDYQLKVYKLLTKKFRDFLSVILGFLIIAVIHLSDRLNSDGIAQMGNSPYTVDVWDPIMLAISIIDIILLGWILVGFINAFLLLSVFIQVSNDLGKDQNISWDFLIKPEEIIQEDDKTKDSSIEYMRVSQITQFSLKRFKRKCNSIPQAILPINILITILLLVAGVGIIYYLNLRGGNDSLELLTLITIVSFLILNLYLFFAPQLSLHKTLKFRKEKTIDVLEEHYERKKIEWLSYSQKGTQENRQILFNELQVLANFIDEIESLLTWPFNYKQLITIFVSGFFGLFVIFDFLDFLSFINNIGPIE